MASAQNEANSGKPERTWEGNVRVRGTAILLRLVMPILHDKGDATGRATRARVCDIQHYAGYFTFVLEVPDDAERGRLIGPRCLHLSALTLLFRIGLRATFTADERPDVVVGIRDPIKQRTLMPQRLFVESDLEPEEAAQETEEGGTGADPETP